MNKETFEWITRDCGLGDHIKVSTVDAQYRTGPAVAHDGYVLVIAKQGNCAIPYDKITIVQVTGVHNYHDAANKS